MKINPSEGEEKLITREQVAEIATKAGREALEYYGNDRFFRVHEEPVDKDGTDCYVYFSQAVQEDAVLGPTGPRQALYQVIQFREGKLILAETQSHGTDRHIYEQKADSVTVDTETSSPWHIIRAEIDFDVQNQRASVIRETVSLGNGTALLDPHYHLEAGSDRASFNLDAVYLTDTRNFRDFPIPEEDIQKLLPAGRAIPLEDLIRSAVNPWGSNGRIFGEKLIPPLMKAEGFPKLGRHREFFGVWEHEKLDPNTTYLEQSLGATGVYGSFHTLESDDPDRFDCLALMIFEGEEGAKYARALKVVIPQNSVAVGQTDGGIPTVKGLVEIDGEVFELEIPKDRITYTTKAEVRGRKIDDTPRPKGKNPDQVVVHIDAQDLATEVAQGYYFNDLIYGALCLYRQKHYTNQEEL